MGFRLKWLNDWKWRSLDLLAHIAAYLLLPGPAVVRAAAFLPDIVVPVLWCTSMCTNELVAEDNVLLRVHKSLHGDGSWYWLPVVSVYAVVVAWRMHWQFSVTLCLLFLLQIFVHLTIDEFTHKGWR